MIPQEPDGDLLVGVAWAFVLALCLTLFIGFLVWMVNGCHT